MLYIVSKTSLKSFPETTNLTNEFDKVEAEQNYYNLLVQYYTKLLEHVDNLNLNE